MKLPDIKRGSRYRSMASMLRAAAAARGMDIVQVADALGFTVKQRMGVANWFAGRNGPAQDKREKLSEILGITPEQWIKVTPFSRKVPKTNGPSEMGPARRAMALAETAKANGEIVQFTPPPADVISVRVRSDATMQLRLDTTLPFAKGAELLRYLLTFGLVIGGEPEESERHDP